MLSLFSSLSLRSLRPLRLNHSKLLRVSKAGNARPTNRVSLALQVP